MSQDESAWNRQKASWSLLKGLHPKAIDLSRTALVRDAELAQLTNQRALESLLLQLGLNDEALNELPASLHGHCGHGLRIWQYPHQFSKYLLYLSGLQVRSYLEIGIRHGGSFVTTTEYLQRFHPLSLAIGVDIIPCSTMAEYTKHNRAAQFWCLNTRGTEFEARLAALGAVDLVFIDSHHEEEQCWREFELLRGRASMIAFHDITNVGCPGIGRVWNALKRSNEYDCVEFVDQYDELGPFMGIGLAIAGARHQAVQR